MSLLVIGYLLFGVMLTDGETTAKQTPNAQRPMAEGSGSSLIFDL